MFLSGLEPPVVHDRQGAQLVQALPTHEATAKSPLVKVKVADWTQITDLIGWS